MMPTDFSKGKTWAILPETFDELARKFSAFQVEKDIKKDLSAAAAASNRDQDLYRVDNGVALLPITGPLTKRTTFWSWLFGGTSYAALAEAFDAAMADPRVKAAVLVIDSPGGTVNGVEAAADRIRAARAEKPVVAYADGLMTSAAYWLGSGARSVIAGRTADIGSIGVLMVHHDHSQLDARIGIKVTYLAAGRYKALGNDAEPLSTQAREVFQAQLDQIYSIFTAAVAQNRGVSMETVLSDMADGRIFIGDQAAAAGLVDRIGSLGDAVALAADLAAEKTPRVYGSAETNKGKGEEPMEIKTIEQLTEAYPDLVKQVRETAKAGVDTSAAAQQGASDERTRILGLAGVQFGEETAAAFAKVVETGVTVEQFTAIKSASPAAAPAGTEAAAVDKAKAEMLESIAAGGPPNPGAGAAAAESGKDFMTLVNEYRAVHKCGVEAAMKAVVKANPEAHQAYIAKAN